MTTEATTRLKVVHFHRHPGPSQHSLERVFATVREHLPPDIEAIPAFCPRPSTGVVNRIINILWARRHQGDVNHITGDVHYLAIGLDPARTILTIHDCASLHRTSGPKRWLLWFFWFWLPLRRSAVVTAVSDFTKSELVQHLGCNPATVCIVPDPVPSGFIWSEKRSAGDSPNVLQVGTGWNKNLERVSKALEGIPCTLDIVGPLTPNHKQILKSNGIRYRNHIQVTDQRLRELYEASDLVVFASLYEGFGLPIIEAQASGRPVVTSNTCSMPEVAGAGACLVEPNSAGSIGGAVVRVLSDGAYWESLIKRGHVNAGRFNAEKIASKYADLYTTLTGKRRRTGNTAQ